MSARERLIDSTVALVRQHGVGSASVSDILDRSGVARRTLYLNFPEGKPALVAAATEAAAATITAGLEHLLTERDPVRVVESFTAMWVRALDAADYHAGCPIVAATLGRDEAPAAADAAAAAFDQWVRLVATCCREAGIDPADAQDLATTVVATIEGAIVMALAARSPEPLQRAGRSLTRLITGALEA